MDTFSLAREISTSISESLKDEIHYGYNIPQNITFELAEFKKRDAVIRGLNDAYERNRKRENIEPIQGTATFKSKNELYVVLQDGSKAVYSAPHIVIATGGCPVRPKDIPGAEYGITGDGFFDIEKLPKKIAFVGAGYIAIKLAGVMNTIGVATHMLIPGETFLRNFNPTIQRTLTKRYDDAGVKIHKITKESKR